MAVDRGYTLLLNHLHNPGTSLALQTIQGALSHHLATFSPSPTPLAGTAISSPYYLSQPINYAKLYSFSAAFRHASHLKYRTLADAERKRSRLGGLFKKSVLAAMDQWVKDAVKGLQGGHPVLRLAACSGLLLGVDDLKRPTKEFGDGLDIHSARGVIEDEDIVALAEVMDTYAFMRASGTSSSGVEEWEKEFQPAGQDLLSLALVFASQSFPLISQNKLKVLPLPILSQILTSTICATFKNGTFLSSVSASVTLSPQHQVHVSPSSAFAQTLQSMATSPLIAGISSLSRFTANITSLLLDGPSDEDARAVLHTLAALRDLAKTVEKDWLSTSLASVTDAGIAPDSQELAKSVWTILKTLLFTIIMISDGALSPLIFLPPNSLPSDITPSSFALATLHTLSHLSFVISQFGGVTSTGNGFQELKKTFYLSLDILAWGDGSKLYGNAEAEAYVRQSCIAINSQRGEGNVMFRQAKQAFTLASIEQLVPVLNDKCIRDWVWGVCYPHLNDASHRETFESAHSVILSIFASHAAQHQFEHRGQEDLRDAKITAGTSTHPNHSASSLFEPSPLAWFRARKNKPRAGQQLKDRGGAASGTSSDVVPEMNAVGPEVQGLSTDFVRRMVPFYARCLIENSAEGRLSTSQLRMAYSALVRSACAGAAILPLAARRDDAPPEDAATDGSALPKKQDEKEKRDKGRKFVQDDAARYALGWYCVRMLLDTLYEIQTPAGSAANPDLKGKGKEKESVFGTQHALESGQHEVSGIERVHRLNLTLISTISSLPLVLLARVLPEIYEIIVTGRPRETNKTPGTLSLHASLSNRDREEKKRELVESLFEEILEGVGDREKQYAMKWWYENREALVGNGFEVRFRKTVSEEQKDADVPPVPQSRL